MNAQITAYVKENPDQLTPDKLVFDSVEDAKKWRSAFYAEHRFGSVDLDTGDWKDMAHDAWLIDFVKFGESYQYFGLKAEYGYPIVNRGSSHCDENKVMIKIFNRRGHRIGSRIIKKSDYDARPQDSRREEMEWACRLTGVDMRDPAPKPISYFDA